MVRDQDDIDNDNKKENITKKKSIILVILIILFLFSIYNIIIWTKEHVETEQLINNLITEVVSNNEENIETKTEDLKINFEKLENINNETIGWIEISKINLNTPIVQTNNNDFYLNYDFYKRANKCGCLFMDCNNNDNFDNKNTIIYGHNLQTGIMFGELRQIYNGKCGNDITINIYSKSKKSIYKVFSTYKEEPNLNIISQKITHNFMKKLKEKSKINFGDIPNEEKKIITLVTCDGTGKGRLVVHGYIID